MSWHKYTKIEGDKLIYKGIDIGLSPEFIFDLKINTGMDLDDIKIENMYNQKISDLRDKKINEILS